MTTMNLLQAVNNALDLAMAENDSVICFGEDIGHFGGVFRATSSLQEKYGKDRCFNTPITEQGIAGFAIGLAAQGSVPVPKFNLPIISFPHLIKSLTKLQNLGIDRVINLMWRV